ncbi:hypothetical protein BTN45_09015 [Rhizobium sp. ZX09]|nr:hypothetical protein BTN45_09015 [Rhizobium sp. ZX09]
MTDQPNAEVEIELIDDVVASLDRLAMAAERASAAVQKLSTFTDTVVTVSVDTDGRSLAHKISTVLRRWR